MTTSKKNTVVLSATALLIAVGVIAISSIKDAQANTAPWAWDVDATCLDSPGVYHCNIPVGALNAYAKLPDLREAVPQQVGVQNSQHTTTLRLSTAIGNTGLGQWQMHANTPATITDPQLALQQLLKADGTLWNEYEVSTFQYHPAHKHFHIAKVTSYELYNASGPTDTFDSTKTKTSAYAEKVTSCLIDWVKISDNSPNNQRAYSNCDGEFQGVSPGWLDQYRQSIPGQELDVTNIPTGYYFIVITANPVHNFIETDFNNNQAWMLIHYINDSYGNPKVEILKTSECSAAESGLCYYTANR